MTTEGSTRILVTAALIALMIAIGLRVKPREVAGSVASGRRVARALLANYVCIPAVAIVLLLALDCPPMVAAGFLVLAVCPGAPYGPLLTSIAKGDGGVAVGLMLLLAASSAVAAPVLLRFLLPAVAGDSRSGLNATVIAGTLLITQLAPLGIGLGLGRWCPTVAERLRRPMALTSNVLNFAALAFVAFTQLDLFSEVRLRGFAGMVLLFLASVAAGWLLGGPGSSARKAMAATTALRNVSVALVIVTGTFPGTSAVSAVIAYGLLSVLGALAFAAVSGAMAVTSSSAARVPD